MSHPSTLIIGLKNEEITGNTKDLKRFIYGYENSEVCVFDEDIQIIDEGSGLIYGIPIADTWNGLVDIEKLSFKINSAKKLFKEKTKQEGKFYFIANQE